MKRISALFFAVCVVVMIGISSSSYAMVDDYFTPEQPIPYAFNKEDIERALLCLKLKETEELDGLAIQALKHEACVVGRTRINEAYYEESAFPNQLQYFYEEPFVALWRDILLRVFYENLVGVKAGEMLSAKKVKAFFDSFEDEDEARVAEMKEECARIIRKQQSRRSARLAKKR